MEDRYYTLPEKTVRQIAAIEGPIAVFGAGGFIGLNLLRALLRFRQDVYGISQDHLNNWRFVAGNIPHQNRISCDINDFTQLEGLIKNLKPKTIFNLAAYGAYSKQKEYKKIYYTNFNSSIDMLELLKNQGFSSYLHAGSSSEYGLNSAEPKEEDELIPNSHYAVSKTAVSYAIKYYGRVEKLPVVHLRLYSAYGPWEEPDRLIPVMVSSARRGEFPSLVQADVSRDFIYISDIITAFISAASLRRVELYGTSFNIGTGMKTTIRELALTVKAIFNIAQEPVFGNMDNRNWDLTDWYANNEKAKTVLDWSPAIDLDTGLRKVAEWQKNTDFDNIWWNWTRTYNR